MDKDEYISPEQARRELGDESYFAFHRWLAERGFRNLGKIYVTKAQLQEFIKETAQSFRGTDSTNALWGDTRELWRGKRIKK